MFGLRPSNCNLARRFATFQAVIKAGGNFLVNNAELSRREFFINRNFFLYKKYDLLPRNQC